MKTNVVVTLQIEGTHKWGKCNIEEVMFLSQEHRHIFYITCKKGVSHDDRDIEIICLKRGITEYLHRAYGKVCRFGNMSCEMIARELTEKFSLCYCAVMEDNENGAEVVA